MLKAVFFDMDGTILDTLGDLTDALNHAFKEAGHRADYGIEMTKLFFGSGVKVAVKRGLATEAGVDKDKLDLIGTEKEKKIYVADDKEVERITKIYMPYYAANCNIKTGPYKGIIEAIRRIREKGIKTAVVSNKPDIAVKKLSEDLFYGLFDISLGEAEGIRRKPAPDMLKKAMDNLDVTAEDSVYVGDSEIDMLTAKNSDMRCISCDWGFRSRDYLEKQGADPIVSDANEMLEKILDI